MPSKITSDLSFGLQFDLVNTNYINVKLLDFVSCLSFKRIHFREIYNVENYGKEPWISSCGRIKNDPKLGFNPWIGKISWRREWIPTPVFLPGESHGQRNLVGYSTWDHKESDRPEKLTLTLSVQFSCSAMFNCLWPHGLQHSRLPCPSPTPGTYSNSCLSSQWCHPTNSSSVVPFSSCLQSFPPSGSLPMSHFFTSGDQNIGASTSASVLTMNFRMDWFDLLAVLGTLKSLLQLHSSKASVLQQSAFFMVQLSHPYRTKGKTIIFTRWTFVSKVMSLLFNMLPRLVIDFLQGASFFFFF